MKLKITKVKNSDGKIDDSKRIVTSGEIKFTMRMRGKSWECTPTMDGQRHNLNLRTADPKRAAKTAIDKIRAISKEQWDVVHAGQTTRGHHTIGEVCELYLGQKGLRVKEKTATDNCTQLLMLVRTACNLKTREAAEGASTSLLTADIVKGYQDKMIKGLKGEKEQRARRSANSTLVQARSIFARYIMADKLYPNLPDISGFLNVRALPAVPKTFRFELIDEWCQKVFANLPELRENDPAAYLYVRLAAGLGLRAREISEARISWIVGAKGGRMLFVQPTETWIPKGRKERKIPLGEDIYHDIVALTDGSEWIVPAENANQRKEGISKRVCVWMTALGWPFDKKVHELRRWFGAQVATQTGSLFDAQRVLGHASHETTNQYYADLVKPPEFTITMGVGQGEPEQSGQRRVVNN